VDSPTTSLGFGTKSTSHNTKTGKAQTTYLPVGETCPDAWGTPNEPSGRPPRRPGGSGRCSNLREDFS